MDAVHHKMNRTLLVWICELNGVSGRCRLPENAMEKVMQNRVNQQLQSGSSGLDFSI